MHFYKWRLPAADDLSARRTAWLYHDSEKRYGSPRIAEQLRKEGWKVSERTVGLLMRKQGLRSYMVRKFKVATTDSNHDLPIAPNLLAQKFQATRPNQKWVASALGYQSPVKFQEQHYRRTSGSV
ncbi:IS3 family transposase [Cohnella nanjingensis]|uniref:IS3 family transposase n=1 Tax=Cohnella nanjingensis TaxID=1387779 RepID=UPI0035E44ABA